MLHACMSSCCEDCGRRHHSILHRFNEVKSKPTEATETVNFAFNIDKSRFLLPTAVIQVVGNSVTFSYRALLGTGAQANLTTETCARKLNF